MRTVLFLSAITLQAALGAQCSSVETDQGSIGSAPYVVYMPSPSTCFNGDVIVFAHGYVPEGSPAGTWLSQLFLPDGTSIPALLNGYGFGFAASGFSADGLAIVQGMSDTAALTAYVQSKTPVRKLFITGASEGGLIATLLLEQNKLYDGGIAVCGPLGDFQKQINYFGDVRVLFDYFFPGVLSSAGGSAINIPSQLMLGWTTVYEPAVVKALNENPLATLQLISTAGIEIGLNYSNAVNAITGALWYNVFATNNAHTVLGGNPYDNSTRVYKGSLNDTRLNANVARFTEANNIPIELTKNYDTTGLLKDPLVTLHTLADPVVPYWQEPLYTAKVQAEHSASELAQIPVLAYGHCNVSSIDADAAVALLILKAGL